VGVMLFCGGHSRALAEPQAGTEAGVSASSSSSDAQTAESKGGFLSSLKQAFWQHFDREVVRGHFDVGSPPNAHRFYCLVDPKTGKRETNGVGGQPVLRPDGTTGIKGGSVSFNSCAEAEQKGTLVTAGYVVSGSDSGERTPAPPAQRSSGAAAGGASVTGSEQSERRSAASGHYMFAWAGDVAQVGNDFLAVIDADPGSASYGRLLTTVVTDQKTMQVHHTEYTMPESGLLFANDHLAGRTFIFDVRDPLQPRVVTSFTDLAGYSHPHSYLRLPNGHVLASFQHMHHEGHAISTGSWGGLVEIDDQGHVVRAASSADPEFPEALLMPYSLVVLPDLDRVLVTNSSMHGRDAHGHTYQVWRLSDLKLLKTAYFDTGGRRYGQIDPEEPRRGPDGSVFVQTYACGLERVTDLSSDNPQSQLVYTFPGAQCGVPTIVGATWRRRQGKEPVEPRPQRRPERR